MIIPIEDVVVEDPPLEDVIAELFRESSESPLAAAAAKTMPSR